MKKLILIIAIGLSLSSCSKSDDDFVSVQTTTTQDTTPSIGDSLDWTFSFSAPSIEINVENAHPYKIAYLEGANMALVGHVFYYQINNCYFTVAYEWENGITQLTGTINGDSFIWNSTYNTINICGSIQNVPVCVVLKSPNEVMVNSCESFIP